MKVIVVIWRWDTVLSRDEVPQIRVFAESEAVGVASLVRHLSVAGYTVTVSTETVNGYEP